MRVMLGTSPEKPFGDESYHKKIIAEYSCTDQGKDTAPGSMRPLSTTNKCFSRSVQAALTWWFRRPNSARSCRWRHRKVCTQNYVKGAESALTPPGLAERLVQPRPGNHLVRAGRCASCSKPPVLSPTSSNSSSPSACAMASLQPEKRERRPGRPPLNPTIVSTVQKLIKEGFSPSRTTRQLSISRTRGYRIVPAIRKVPSTPLT